ncbi:MAG: nicotinate-nucleotide--dimethylbenzimidazole phosphoribosyltransferase [Eubacteriales bacterium]|nr:nicotinate-nucleotide--dimethylbenzimidazole phosphoribosyltransferase [Lachnospiraceae bacterium]MDO5127995.1 nicotinate-nucleotide--dimethylbenzimidazole phosphoribosyltransferase [Eubacteriales bacterium]
MHEIYRQAKKRFDQIAKPIDSLGMLEDMVCKLCAIAQDVEPYPLSKRALVVMCADHGVVSEGVTQTGCDVTRIVAENFAKHSSCVNYMSDVAGVDVFAVDIGMNTPHYKQKTLVTGAVIDRKIAEGTNNLADTPAMTMEQCKQAIAIGETLVRELKEMGYHIVATGEMGIGNTTPSSVLAALFLDLPVEKVTGRGAGLDDEGFRRKRLVIERAIKRIKEKNEQDPMKLLAEGGGYELAGMVGMYLGAVKERMPIIIDGAISAVAALVASRIDERVPQFAFASHVSEEPVGKYALSAMGLPAMLHGRMCLGEGSGAVALLPLLDMAMAVYSNMATFSDLQIDAYDRSGKPGQEEKE